MANPLYGYNGTGYGTSSATLSGAYSSRSVSEQYLPDSSLRYLSSDPLSTSNRSSMYYPSASASAAARISSTPAHLMSQTSWSSLDSSLDPVSGLKRSSEAFYHPTGLGAHNAIGQSEAWLSADYLAKRPRLESASNLPIYPQRPGEKDCVHYMQTRTCKFGDGCKFDHPIWVPEGGIPDWKEVPFVPIEALPERPGEADCPYFMKTQKCKFGLNCKFNHPKDYVTPLAAPEKIDASTLPERPTEPSCSFYMKTGTCKFGTTCIFHHPRDIQIPSVGQENGTGVPAASASNGVGTYDGKPANSIFPAIAFNSKGLPIRLGEVDCPFYLKTGSCKYGAACRYSHPDRNAINPPAAAIGNPFGVSPAATLNVGVVNPAASVLSAVDPRLASTVLGLGAAIYPQRPGQTECDYYMKTGVCKYVERCKFHHPIDRSAPLPKVQENVKLTPAGFPRREGAIHCPYYMKTGICKYAAACKFDHPPPGEVMAMATLPTSVEGEGKEDGEEDGAGVAQIQ